MENKLQTQKEIVRLMEVDEKTFLGTFYDVNVDMKATKMFLLAVIKHLTKSNNEHTKV